MAICQIERLIDQSGGFGCHLVLGGDLAEWSATVRSSELFAQYVIPHFQGQPEPLNASYDWILGTDHQFVKAAVQAIDKSIEADAMSRAAWSRRPSPIGPGSGAEAL